MSRWTSWNRPGCEVKPLFTIARGFQSKGSWTDRLLVANGEDWRSPRDEELDRLTLESPAENDVACSLFSTPAHMRRRFWSMLNEEVAEGAGDFASFSDELARFLTFKDLSPPRESVCELLVQSPGGRVKTADVWALINFGEESVLLAWPQLRVQLSPGEGCRMTASFPPEILPPPTDELNALLVIRVSCA
jgi:hypothetical protein